ncbi:hypothetical protein AVEN_142985-1 [Araneus ventricosus]|uniref:Uncharacterized protein n=1 Tax=Araneus ventricosus TaxID=182803 RepID=A0A4Y2X4D7_ARAVE|nr:hypothetical protein AVEN_142985-1 [Araneus ventricosus]
MVAFAREQLEIFKVIDRSFRTINRTGIASGILRLPHRWKQVALRLKLGIHKKARLCHLSQDRFFSTHSSRKIRRVIHGGSKVRYRRSSIPLTPPHTRRISDFLASSLSPCLGRTFYLPLPSQRGPQKAIRAFQFDFKLFAIPTLPFSCANFHRFLTLTKGISSPRSKNRRVEQL